MHNDLQCYNELQYTMDTMEQWPTITYNIQWATMDNDTTIKSHANTTLLFIYYNGIVLKWQWTQWKKSQYYNVSLVTTTFMLIVYNVCQEKCNIVHTTL